MGDHPVAGLLAGFVLGLATDFVIAATGG